MRGRVLAFSIAALLALTAVGIAWFNRSDFERDPGVLVQAEVRSTSSLAADVGSLVTWGDIIVKNDGSQPVALDELALPAGKEAINVSVERVEVVDLSRWNGEGVALWLGDADDVVPVAVRAPFQGYVLPPGGEVNVLVLFKLQSPGDSQLSDVELRYRAGGERFRLRSSKQVRLCAPAGVACKATL